MYFAYARSTKNWEKTQAQYDELSQYFIIEKCDMGQDPKDILKNSIDKELQKTSISSQWLTLHYLERYTNKGILFGYYKNDSHLQWILGNNDKGSLVYNVRLLSKGEEPRDGANTSYFYEKKDIKFVVLYTDDVEETGKFRVFHVKDTASKVSNKKMRDTWYPFDVNGSYFFFRFDEEITLGKLQIRKLLTDLRRKHLEEFGSYVMGEPMITTAENVLKYREGF